MKRIEDGKIEKAIKEINVLVKKATVMMNEILWDQLITKGNKRRICNSIIDSTFTDGSVV